MLILNVKRIKSKHIIHIMDVISAFIDDCFIALCIPSTKCGILWGASCIVINCCECVCKKNAPCRNEVSQEKK
jgi:hypothetical protein